MASDNTFHNELILKGYRELIPFFEELGIRNTNDLMSLKDSTMLKHDYDANLRLRMLNAANKILKMELPFSDEIIYAFDVDGTLTPTPGSVRGSLWYFGPERYYLGLSEENRDALVRMLTVLPDPLILISRNSEEKVRGFFRMLNPGLEARINSEYSAFRTSGSHPTDEAKDNALLNLANIGRPVFYVDDSKSEIDHCVILATKNQYLACYQVGTWIGNPTQFTEMANGAVRFHAQIEEMAQ